MTFITESEKEFDEKFGTPLNSSNYTVGSHLKQAGCDDCVQNLIARDEYKSFHLSQLKKFADLICEKIEDRKGMSNKELDIEDSPSYGKALSDIKKLIQEEIK